MADAFETRFGLLKVDSPHAAPTHPTRAPWPIQSIQPIHPAQVQPKSSPLLSLSSLQQYNNNITTSTQTSEPFAEHFEQDTTAYFRIDRASKGILAKKTRSLTHTRSENIPSVPANGVHGVDAPYLGPAHQFFRRPQRHHRRQGPAAARRLRRHRRRGSGHCHSHSCEY